MADTDAGSQLEVAINHTQGAFRLAAAFGAPLRGITALFGASGAGKTTVVRAIAGLIRPDEGRIAIGDWVLFDSAQGIEVPIEERGIGYVFQDTRLFPHLDVEANLRFGERRARGRPRTVAFENVVELLGIGHLRQRRTAALSGGEKQRVALGRALLAQPRLLLLDEPLAALDHARRAEILPYIEQLRDELGMPIVYVSHAIDEVVRLATRVVLMAEGQVVATGGVEDIFSRGDLRRHVGRRLEAGTVLTARVAAQDDAMALTHCVIGTEERDNGPALSLPQISAAVGTLLRLRILARDVAIALSEPLDTSIGNRWRGEVQEIVAREGPYAEVSVRLDSGVALWSLVTRAAVARLRLQAGMPVWCLVKTVAVDTRALGFAELRN